jgi:hypothetical protein
VEQPKPRPERPSEPKDDPRVVAHRCPFCHEAVRPDAQAWVACAQCLGRQHAACWAESGRCGACAHERHLEAPTSRRARPPALGPLVLLFVAVLVVGWAAGAVLLVPSPVTVPEVARPSAPPPPPLVTPDVPPEAPGLFDDLLRRSKAEAVFRRGTPDERFDWVPEEIEEGGGGVAWRILDPARERLRQRPSEVASLVLDAHEADRLEGDGAGAIRLCDQAIRLDPRYGMAWTVRGWALLGVRNYSVAEQDLRRGAELSHDPTWAWIGLGRWAEAYGDPAAALKAYREALRLGGAGRSPVDHEADLRARIERLSAARVTSPR